MSTWKCLPCIIQRKAAEKNGTAPGDLPPIRPSVTLLNMQPHCYEHIEVKVQSPLMVPTDGAPMPPALVRSP